MPLDRGMDREDVVHVYNGILLSHKKAEIMPFATTWMDLEIITLVKYVRQKKTNVIDHLYTWNLSTKEKQTLKEQTCGYQGGPRRGGMKRKFGISRCKLLYIEWINNVLLYSTRNYIQYPVINNNGKEYERTCIYICTSESLCYTAEINTTLKINYTSIK